MNLFLLSVGLYQLARPQHVFNSFFVERDLMTGYYKVNAMGARILRGFYLFKAGIGHREFHVIKGLFIDNLWIAVVIADSLNSRLNSREVKSTFELAVGAIGISYLIAITRLGIDRSFFTYATFITPSLPLSALSDINTECSHIENKAKEDPILNQFVCPITHQPIFNPLLDPKTKTLYERTAILHYLQEHKKCPISREPLDQSSLCEPFGVASIINDRLAEIGRSLSGQ